VTPEQQLEADRAERALLRDREMRRAERERALPLPEQLPAVPTFAPLESEPAAQAREAEEAYKALAERVPLPGDQGASVERERRRLETERLSQQRSIEPGQVRAATEADQYMFPTFRPTRIRRVAPDARFAAEPETARPEELSDVQLDNAILASAEGTERLAELDLERERRQRAETKRLRETPMEQLIAQQAPAPGAPEGEVMYLDEGTGKLRKPTAGEELWEALGKQVVMSEAAAKAASKRIKDAQSEMDRRVAAGEDVSWYEAAGPLFSGILSTPDELGAGTTETELGAALRSGLGVISTLAAEGYFRGLGYEVDKNGVPKDPDDFGLAVANLRRQVGLPEVIYPAQAFETAVTSAIKPLSPELASSVGNAIKAIPQLAFPLPGVATEGTERGPTAKDPEGRRRLSGIEVPSLLEDPKGFADAELRRLARSLASGRTIGDEVLDSPAARKFYAEVYGDEDAAFWGGSVVDLLIPAGPGTIARLLSKAPKAVARSAPAAAAAGRLIGKAEAMKAANALGATPINVAADFAAVVTKGRASDGRVVRRVAENVIGSMNIPAAKRELAKRAIKATSNTVDEVAKDVKSVLRGPEFDYYYNTFVRNVPDDMVMVTDRVAVPRALAPKWKARATQIKQEVLLRPLADVRAELDTVALTPALRAELGNLYKIVDNAKGRVLSQSERVAFDKAWRKFAAKNGLDPEDATLFTTKRPADLDGRYDPNETWSQIPSAAVERLLNRAVDAELFRAIPREARLAKDLTGAQIAASDFAKNIGRVLGDSMVGRRLRATRGKLRQETVASAATRKQIESAAQVAIRDDGAEIVREARRTGSLQEGIDSALARRLAAANVPPAEAWDKALEAIYGNPEVAKAVKAGVFADASNLPPGIVRTGASGAPEFARYPRVADLKAVDLLYARAGKFMFRTFSNERLWGAFLPDYEKGLLKVFLEEGTRKRVAAVAKKTDIERGAETFLADPTLNATAAKAAADVFAEEIKLATRDPSLAKVEVRAFSPSEFSVRLYDPAASDIERKLAESGEELFALPEGIDPRLRADITTVASQARDWAITNLAKNMENAIKYGYYIPNIPYIAAKIFSIPIVSLVTSGLSRTGQALDQVVNRRIRGGGLTLPDGRYLTPDDLEYEARFHGVGLTEVESARVGALADDLLRAGREAAAEGKGVFARYSRLALEAANPFSRTIGQRLAHAAELSFRRATFEARLVAGDSFTEAAAAARRSALDFSASPDIVKNTLGRYLADASGQFQLAVELLRYGKENTATAVAFAKANSARAKSEDPYGIHGDRALKSLGIVRAGDRSYYLPSIGRVYAPLEYGLAAARGGNRMLASMIQAYELGGREAEEALLAEVAEDGLMVARTGLNAVLPAVSASIDAFLENMGADERYLSNEVPGAKPMDDTTAFWTAAVLAHHNDLDRKNGDWDFFLDVFQPDFILPPAEQAAYPGAKDLRRQYWKTRPEGMPYLVWGTDTDSGETVYKAFQPSAVGLMNLQIARAVPGSKLAETLGVVGAAFVEEQQGGPEPVEVRAEAAVPRLDTEAPETALDFLLGRAPTPEAERRRQAAALAAERPAAE
jgi:hypothetical protein